MDTKKSAGKEGDSKPANEIWVTSQTTFGPYLAYVSRLFGEKYEDIMIKAMGRAIPRALDLGMKIRGKFKGIHQIAEVKIATMNDKDQSRLVPQVIIHVSKKTLDKSHVGYTAPLPDSEVDEYQPFIISKPNSEESKGSKPTEEPKNQYTRGGNQRYQDSYPRDTYGQRYGGRRGRGFGGFGRFGSRRGGRRAGRGGFRPY